MAEAGASDDTLNISLAIPNINWLYHSTPDTRLVHSVHHVGLLGAQLQQLVEGRHRWRRVALRRSGTSLQMKVMYG